MLGLRFQGDFTSPQTKFDMLSRELGSGFEGIVLPDSSANPAAMMKNPHSVLTEHLIDEAGQPTKKAAERVIGFFRERLGA